MPPIETLGHRQFQVTARTVFPDIPLLPADWVVKGNQAKLNQIKPKKFEPESVVMEQ